MRRPSRRRRVLKWGGFVACVLIITMGLASYYWVVAVKWLSEDCAWVVRLSGAALCVHHWSDVPALPPVLEGALSDLPGFHVRRRWDTWHPHWLPEVTKYEQGRISPQFRQVTLILPLWIPFVALAVPTALLWWRDRRPLKGYCKKCGYNLTGNVSGRCPECGEAVGPETPRGA